MTHVHKLFILAGIITSKEGDSMTVSKKKQNQKFYVVKANDLIRKTRYNLTTQQQKIVLFAISKIRPNDDIHQWYEIDIKDICEACGIDMSDTGFYYKAIKADLLKLTSRLWVQLPDKREVTVSWIADAQIIPLSGTVHIRFHEMMAPYLFELKNRYTQYQLEDVLVFRGKYAIRLYEILRSYTTEKDIREGTEREVMMELEELRQLLAVEGYKDWRNFERRILKAAVEEINQYSDKIHINYDTYATGRKIDKINFIISGARGLQILNARRGKRERL